MIKSCRIANDSFRIAFKTATNFGNHEMRTYDDDDVAVIGGVVVGVIIDQQAMEEVYSMDNQPRRRGTCPLIIYVATLPRILFDIEYCEKDEEHSRTPYPNQPTSSPSSNL